MSDSFGSALRILWRRKIWSSPGDGGHVRQRMLSVVDITCLGISTTIGTGIYTLLAVSAKEQSGPSIVLSLLICSVNSCLAGMCYSELSTRFPKGGSAYCYVYSCFGEFPAFLIGWSLVIEYTFFIALSLKSLLLYLFHFIDQTICNLTIILNNSIHFNGISALLALIFTISLTKNLKLSCTFNNVLVFVGYLVIGGIVLSCIPEADVDNWTTGPGFFANGLFGVLSGASLCAIGFNGYDIIGCLSAECTDPGRAVGPAIALTFVLTLIASFASSISITLLVPISSLDSKVPLLEMFSTQHLNAMKYFVVLGATSALTSSSIASLLSLSRLVFTLSNDGLFFAFLSEYHTNKGLSKRATLFSGLITCLTCVCFESSTLLHFIGCGTILSYISVAFCILFLRYSTEQSFPFENNQRTDIEITSSPHDITQSISEYYLNQRSNDQNKEDSPKTEHLIEILDNATCLSDTFHDVIQVSSAHHYGSCPPRDLSVQFVNDSFITSIQESPFSSKQLPSSKSASFVAKMVTVMTVSMVAMPLINRSLPIIFSPGVQIFWISLISNAFFFLMSLMCIVVISGQPRLCPQTDNAVSCVPLVPIVSIWLNINLILCLPYTSWLAFLIWSLLGIFVYMSYGVWNSWHTTAHPHSQHSTTLCFSQTIELSEDSIADHDQQFGCDQLTGSSV